MNNVIPSYLQFYFKNKTKKYYRKYCKLLDKNDNVTIYYTEMKEINFRFNLLRNMMMITLPCNLCMWVDLVRKLFTPFSFKI